jgi:hypothetical protein
MLHRQVAQIAIIHILGEHRTFKLEKDVQENYIVSIIVPGTCPLFTEV